MRDEMQSALMHECEALLPAVIEFTKAMVRKYSVLGHEEGALEVVARELHALDLPVQRVPMHRERLEASVLYAPVEWRHEDKYNLVAALNSGAAGKSLVLNGHVDVVSAEPFDMWTRAPNEPWEQDGWLYGRGAGDMQSGVAAMIYAVHAVQRAGYRICSPLTIQAVVEEECSGNGALACLQQGHTGDFVLIPEPFGARIYTGQIGVLWFKVSVEGVPAHVLATSQGSNAIERLWRVVPALKALERCLNEDYRTAPYDTIAQPYCLNIGVISGGNWPSSVPASAQLEGRIGFPLCLSVDEMMKWVQQTVEQALNDGASSSASRTQPAVSFHGFRSAGHLVDLQHPGIDMLSVCHRSVTGRDIEHYLSTCTTDLRAFHHHGRTAGTCYGPEARNIHGIDECVNLESVLLTMKTYATFISRWCTLERV